MKNPQTVQSEAGAPQSKFRLPWFVKLVLALLSLAVVAFASTMVKATPLLSQGFLTEKPIAPGSIVSLKSGSTNDVEPASSSNVNNILGVVINGAPSPVSISSGSGKQVQVATNGVEYVLVSDINGDIDAGDSITASPIAGVGMKATSNIKIVGISQDKFPNSTSTKQSYTDKSGQKHDVKLGQVAVLVNVSDYYKQPEKTLVPQAVQNIANSLAGKKVNTLPIIISVAIFIITMIIVVVIIYSLIHSSIISVGRNPMSQSAVYRNVLQLSTLVVIILVVSMAAIYMVLRKF